MSDRSKIEWTDASWNPIRAQMHRTDAPIGWHCERVSEACRNCYAEAMNRRLGTKLDYVPKFRESVRIFLDEKMLLAPLAWKRPRRIFVCSMTDLFADFITDDMLDKIFAVMALCPQHTFQVLTKRPARMRQYLTAANNSFDIGHACGRIADIIERMRKDGHGMPWNGIGPVGHLAPGAHWWPLSNIWLGVTCEDQQTADERIPELLATPAAIRFISAEPLLGRIDLERVGTLATILAAIPGVVEREECGRPKSGAGSISGVQIDAIGPSESSITFFQTPDHMGGFTAASPRQSPRLDWVICGGESGPHARPMHPDWARNLRDQCADAGVPFFFKQWGEFREYDHETREITLIHDGTDIAEAALSSATRPSWITAAGRHIIDRDDLPEDGEQPARLVERLGKKAAGRLLDGMEHNAFPEIAQ